MAQSLAAFVQANLNTAHVIYGDANNHVMDLYWQNGGWHHNDLTVAAGNPPGPAPGTPLVGHSWESRNTAHVIYADVNNHVMELYWDGNWHNTDLTVASGVPPTAPAPGTSLVAYAFENTKTQHRFYFGYSPAGPLHVMELYGNDNGWGWSDITDRAGNPTGPATVTSLVGFAFEKTNTAHVMYVDEPNHVMELYWDGGWNQNDLNKDATHGHPGVVQNPTDDTPLVGYAWEETSTAHVMYLGINNDVIELWWDNGWNIHDLFVADPTAPTAPLRNTPLTGYAFGYTSTQHVMYLDINNHVAELWWDDNGWHHNDLTAATGVPWAPADGTPLVGFAFGNTQHVLYWGVNNHVVELWWDDNGWAQGNYNDLTVASGVPSLATANA
jgi:hypothetical protein